tara:strand:- start:146 stop:463 length:318 start_codon:yes stop_codon:yes gene_type:complete
MATDKPNIVGSRTVVSVIPDPKSVEMARTTEIRIVSTTNVIISSAISFRVFNFTRHLQYAIFLLVSMLFIWVFEVKMRFSPYATMTVTKFTQKHISHGVKRTMYR